MMPVCVSVTVSLAFGTTAPVASVTVPSNVAFTAWDQPTAAAAAINKERRSEEHTSELQSLRHLVCRLLLEKKKSDHEETLPPYAFFAQARARSSTRQT